MVFTKDVHKQFADYFAPSPLCPYIYLLSKGLSEGHVCIDLDEISLEELAEAGYTEVLPPEALKDLSLLSLGGGDQPFVLFQGKLYFQRYFLYETRAHEKIMDLLRNQNSLEDVDRQLIERLELVETLFPDTSPDTDWQMIAALSVCLNRFTIISGGPGTGKTTTVAKALTLLYEMDPEARVALAAPTGKAAARMAESLKNAQFASEVAEKVARLEPSTIHRLLGAQKNSIYFRHDADRPIPYDIVLIDESSMMDLALFTKLLDAIPTTARLILLGDKNQLASVEAGSLFGDLCLSQAGSNCFSPERAAFLNQFIRNESKQLPLVASAHSRDVLQNHVVELQYSHRFSSEGGIGKFSKALLQGQEDAIRPFFDNSDPQIQMDSAYSESIFETAVERYFDYLEESDIRLALEKFQAFRILCAVREGPQGVYAANDKVQRFLQAKKKIRMTGEFYEHRPVMITKNNYDLELFNGDIGLVRKDEFGNLRAWFEDRSGVVKSVSPAFLDSVETVFAMTIHKSQGSEFDQVLLQLPQEVQRQQLLSRELLYTAVTRARSKVILQATEEAVLHAAASTIRRGSGMAGRLASSVKDFLIE